MMKTLLLINTSPNLSSSYSRQLTDNFKNQWQQQFPTGKIITRDIGRDPIPHLLHDSIEPIIAPQSETTTSVGTESRLLLTTLISEIKAADVIVFGVPMHNLSIPSTLKAYFDHIAVDGLTWGGVKYGSEKQVVVITTGGSSYHGTEYDFQAPYIKAFLKTIDLVNVTFIRAHGLCKEEGVRHSALTNAEQEISQFVAKLNSPSKKIEHGLESYRQGKYEAAIQSYTNALSDDSKNAFIYLYRGDAQFALQQFERAIQDYSQAIALNPTQPVFYANRAEARRYVKDIAGSVEDLRTAIAVDDTDNQQVDYPYYRLARELMKDRLRHASLPSYENLAQKAYSGFFKKSTFNQQTSNLYAPYTLYYLGRCYELGCGVNKNHEMAKDYYQKASQLSMPHEKLAHKCKKRLSDIESLLNPKIPSSNSASI
jgi:FMN-dependent NADH-azoreductase